MEFFKKKKQIYDSLCEEAISLVRKAYRGYDTYTRTSSHTALRDADQAFGKAQGIYRVLVQLGYKSTLMDELYKNI